MVRVLIKDKYGNRLIERKDKAIGVKNAINKYLSKSETKKWVLENKLGNKIRLKEGGMLWIHNDLLE